MHGEAEQAEHLTAVRADRRSPDEDAGLAVCNQLDDAAARRMILPVWLLLAPGGCRAQPLGPDEIDIDFTLKTDMVDGRMIFVGAGGEIDGLTNPDLVAGAGDTARVVLVNDDGIPHDFAIPELYVQTQLTADRDQSTFVVFEAGESGSYTYFCTVSGHRQMGMEGRFIVESAGG